MARAIRIRARRAFVLTIKTVRHLNSRKSRKNSLALMSMTQKVESHVIRSISKVSLVR